MHRVPSHPTIGERHRTRRLLAALALAAALIVPATAIAASPNNWTDSAFLEYGNQACGAHIPGAPILGTVDFTRTGGKMSLTVELDGDPATANTDYVLTLWDASDCSQIGGMIATLTTDGFGVASGTFDDIKVKGTKSFFATLYNMSLGFYNDTTIVP